MSWVEKCPNPGAKPPKPEPANIPAFGNDELRAYNTWVVAKRRHNLATAIDALAAREATGTQLTDVEVIALTVGIMILEGSIREHDASNPFSVFFP